MGLTWFAPLALALSALALLPIVAHLARQTPRTRQPFGAMLLLERVVKRLRRRRQVRDPVLLALRVLALLALILALAGPRWTMPGGPAEYGATGQVVLVVDRSLSMSLQDRGSTLLKRARDRATDVISRLPEGVAVGLVVYDDDALRLTNALTADHARVAAQIDAIQPTSGGSNLRAALLEARRLLGGEPGEVLLFSDEAGPRMIPEASAEIQRLVEQRSAILSQGVHADPPRNVAVTQARYRDGVEGGQVILRVANFGPDPTEVGCEVTLPDGASIPIFVDLPPDGEAEERITIPREAQGGVGEVRCDDPDLTLDDARYFHLPKIGASRVLVVDGDPGDSPTRSEIYFLERALAPWGGLRSGVSIDVTTPVGLLDLDPDVHRVVFLANVPDPRPFGPRLTEFVRNGGNLVVTGGDNVTNDRYNAALGSILPAPLRQSRALADLGEEGVPIALPDVREPLFQPFRRGGRSSFAAVRSHTVLTFEPFDANADDISVLLSYDNGLPALVERRIGQGRVVVWTSTVDTAWGNLPMQAVFMPLVQRLVAYLGGEAGAMQARFEGTVGQPVTIPLPDLAIQPVVQGPDGAVRSRIQGAQVIFTPDEAGAYRLEIDSAPPLAFVAVNVDPQESDVRRTQSVESVERDLSPDLLTTELDLSPWLLAAAMLLFVGQAGWALRSSRTASALPVAPPSDQGAAA